MIPLFQPRLSPAVLPRLEEIFQSGRLAAGEYNRAFEQGLAEFLGNPRLITCSEASAALAMALFQAGVRPGDEVISSPAVCLATSMPALNLFARVAWCDVDPRSGNLAAASLEQVITPRTRAIVVNHWAGEVADLDALHAVAARHELAVIEDAGEALGAEHHGRRLGTTGSFATVFSFYANRHLTTGQGAAVAYREKQDWEAGRWLRHYGIHQPSFRDSLGEIDPASDIAVPGYGISLNDIAAAIGQEQLAALPGVVERHRANGEFLARAFETLPGVENLRRLPETRAAFWVFTLLAERRDDLLRALRDRGIHASKLHLRNDRYSCFGAAPRPLPGVEAFAAREIVLPCGWWVTDEDRERIVAAVKQGW